MASKYKKTVRRRRITFVIGVLLLLVAATWTSVAVPRIVKSYAGVDLENQDAAADPNKSGGAMSSMAELAGGKDGPEKDLLEGDLSLPGLLVDMVINGETDVDIFNLTMDDLAFQDSPVVITSKGSLKNSETGEIIFDDLMESDGESPYKNQTPTAPSFFPLMGVEPEDHILWSFAANDTVTAQYLGGEEVLDNDVYRYRTETGEIESDGGGLIDLDAIGSEDGGDGDEGGENPLVAILAEATMLYS